MKEERQTNGGKPHECGKIAVHKTPKNSGLHLCNKCNMPVDAPPEPQYHCIRTSYFCSKDSAYQNHTPERCWTDQIPDPQWKEKMREEWVEHRLEVGWSNMGDKEVCDFFFSHFDTLMESKIGEIETYKKNFANKGYNGNDLESACDYYGIAAEDWSEIIRYEDGYNMAIANVLSLLRGQSE